MKEDFDDILRKKWEEKQFPVDQAHRADMIQLLDQNNRRRTGFLWWFFGVGVASAIIALVVILNDAERLDKVMTPIENVPAVEAEEAKAKAEAKAKEKTEAKAKAEAKAKEDGNTNDIAKPEKEAHTSANNLQAVQAGTVEQKETKSQGNAVKLQDAKKENVEINGKAKAAEIIEVDIKTNVNKSKTISKVVDKKKEQTITSTHGIDNPGDEKIELNANQSNLSDNGDIVISTEAKVTVVPNAISNGVESSASPVEIANENIPLVVRNDFVTDPIDALAFGNIDFINNDAPGNIDPVIVKHHPVWLYAEAGMGFVPAPKSNIKSGYTMRAGGGVGYGLSAKNSLTLSGGYLVQKNGFDFQRSSTAEQSGFGWRSNFNTLTPDRLHFVYARLGVHHRIQRHMISVFGGGQYLYGAQGFVVVKSDDQLTGISEKPGEYSWLKLDGMNRWWWNAELNYGYQLTPRLSIQAGVKYNFTSLVATDQDLEDKGYFWKGDLSSLSPSFTINYHLYGKR